MKKIASNELKEFLQDWLGWAEGRGCEIEYEPYLGLCGSSEYFSDDCSLPIELEEIFEGDAYPFGEGSYYQCGNNDTQHKDPNRLAWVRAALNDTLDTWDLME